jgi:hypothetical protein
MKVFIVQGEHWNVPGRPMSAHATKASADAEARQLVNLMVADLNERKDCSLQIEPATSEDWNDKLQTVRMYLGDATGATDQDDTLAGSVDHDDLPDVWITELELEGYSEPREPDHERKCPSHHYNDGTDTCADCGADLN